MSPPPQGPLSDIGEFALIDAVTAGLGSGEDVLVGPGDDSAVLAVPGGEVVTSVDVLVEGVDFRRHWSTASDVGAKAAAGSLSDINAMGGRTTALLVALVAPSETDVAWLTEMSAGIAAEAERAGAAVVGGDVAAGPAVMVSVTALGVCPGPVVRRGGARAGDQVALCGRQGWSGAGLAVLGRGFRSPRAVVDVHRHPEPPYHAGPEAAALGATAMIDVSDGLVQDLGHVAAASEVAIDVESALLEVPEPLQAVGAALGVDPLGFVLTGGEDYGLVATFPEDVRLPDHWRVIGAVSAEGEAGTVTVDHSPYPLDSGHRHFR